MASFSAGQSVVVTGYDREWGSHTKDIEECVGKTGEVISVDFEGDVLVEIDGDALYHLASCLEVIDSSEPAPSTPAYETRVTGMTVVPTGKPIFDQLATEITVADECGGEFVVVKQTWRDGKDGVAFDAAEWPAIRDAIESMIKTLRV